MRTALVVLLIGCASCTLWLRDPLRLGDHIRAPHDRHAAAKVDCLVCHESIYDAKTLEGQFLPSEKVCLGCHREAKEQGRCNLCHTDVRRAGPWPQLQSTVRVSHSDHIERTKEDCKTCHKQLPNPLRTTAMSPSMQACLGCHEHRRDYDQGRCNKCHTNLERYPLEPIADFSHAGNYVQTHMDDARSAADRCATCHEQTFCADCHAKTAPMKIELKLPERVDADFIHRGDYVGRHAVDAQGEPATCRRCHGSSFCDSCHRANNLTPFGTNPRDPHPLGWAFPGSAQFHGTAARRDITACAGCHDQGARSICVDCHKVGGVGGNPHPLGWTDRHPREEIGRNGMCLACHAL
jgi:hypothetical protein